MANENFSLGFTVSDIAFWSESGGQVGPATPILMDLIATDVVGPAIAIFGDLVSLDITGPATPVLMDLVATNTTGPAATADTNGLCQLNLLSLPGQSTLSGPEFSTLSCP